MILNGKGEKKQAVTESSVTIQDIEEAIAKAKRYGTNPSTLRVNKKMLLVLMRDPKLLRERDSDGQVAYWFRGLSVKVEEMMPDDMNFLLM